jgi:hypothetical protein
MYKRKGNYPKALEYYNQSLKIKEKLFGKDHFQTSYAMEAIAEVYASQAKYDDAL